MSSIAYVTDSNMIEYHRLNGNRSLNFWRPSAGIRFSDFHKGDILFFLAKGTEKGRGTNREKGIVGYGIYDDGESMPPAIAWKKYTTKNGYNTKEEFFETIQKISKSEDLPENISCLQLEEVVFFQSPIYLSEIGIQISNNVESYIYIDKDDETATLQILDKAKEVGIDLWSLSFDNHHDVSVFEYTKRNEIVRKICEFLNESAIDDKELKIAHKIAYAYLMKHVNEDIDFINGSYTDLCQMRDDKTIIYAPLVANSRNRNVAIQRLIGRLMSYKSLISIDPNNDSEIELHAIVEDLDAGLVLWIKQAGIYVDEV